LKSWICPWNISVIICNRPEIENMGYICFCVEYNRGRVPLVEQERSPFLSSTRFLVGFVLLNFFVFLCNVFVWPFCCLAFFELQIMITPSSKVLSYNLFSGFWEKWWNIKHLMEANDDNQYSLNVWLIWYWTIQ
jgi:hypothetical protein